MEIWKKASFLRSCGILKNHYYFLLICRNVAEYSSKRYIEFYLKRLKNKFLIKKQKI